MNKNSKQGDETRAKLMLVLTENQIVICPLSFEEIAGKVGVKSISVVSHHLKVLEKQKLIKRPKNTFRHIEIIQQEEPMLAATKPISNIESASLVKWLIANRQVEDGKYGPKYFVKFNIGGVVAELKKEHIKVTEKEVLTATRRIMEI